MVHPPVILFATAKSNDLVFTKAVRFESTTTVREAVLMIADKCSLNVPEQELLNRYVLCFPQNKEDPDSKLTYLTDLGQLLLESSNFADRDKIELRNVVESLTVATEEGKEFIQPKVDLETSVGTFLEFVAPKFNFTPVAHYELCIKHDDKITALSNTQTLKENHVTHDTNLVLRLKQKHKKKIKPPKKQTSSLLVSEPMFVKRKGDEFHFDDKERGTGQPIFGFPIARALQRADGVADYQIAPLVINCISFVEQFAMNVEGIFRISAKSDQIDKLKARLDSNTVDEQFEADAEPHLVCSILKQYLRDLPEPVVPYRFYHTFLDLHDKHTDEQDIKVALIVLLKQLPQANFVLLRKLAMFFNLVSQHEAQNKMSIRNLATVVGPNLLRYPDNDDVMMIIRDAPRVTNISSVIIKYADELFPENPYPPPQGSSSLKSPKRGRKGSQSSRRLKILGYTKANYAYSSDPKKDCEISFTKGAVIVVFAKLDSGWWVGSVIGSNVAGFFPSNYCTELAPSIGDVPSSNTSNSTGSTTGSVVHSHSTSETVPVAVEKKIADLESEMAILRAQLAEQKELAKKEAEQRKQSESLAIQHLDQLTQILSSHLDTGNLSSPK